MEEYIQKISSEVKSRIEKDINPDTIGSVVEAIKINISDTRSKNFQKYYFATIGNSENYLNDTSFFHTFKSKYALQGIDNHYLDTLEATKLPIYELLTENKLMELYFAYFAQAKLKRGDKTVDVDLASFFAKLVHTFKPNDYCALDNPIKNYFGLKRESFYLAFMIISSEYKAWIINNHILLKSIRDQIAQIDSGNIIIQEKLTDMKIMDLLFWRIAKNEEIVRKLNKDNKAN